MKYKIEEELLEEVSSLKYVKIQLDQYKVYRERLLQSMQPKDLKGIDYSKLIVDGGMIKSTEQEFNELIQTNQCITALEQIQNTLEEILTKKCGCIKDLLTERERIVFQRTFIDGITCEDLGEELGISDRTIRRDRALIIAKIRKLRTKVEDINNKITQNVL